MTSKLDVSLTMKTTVTPLTFYRSSPFMDLGRRWSESEEERKNPDDSFV
jgi:hypothetical protein